MIRVLVLVPVLGRPERAEMLAASLLGSYVVRRPLVALNALFLVSPDDHDQREAVNAVRGRYPGEIDGLDVEWDSDEGGDYARKINAGWQVARSTMDADFVFLGADDLDFQPGWIQQALSVQLDTGACVVGVNDLGAGGTQRGTAATHSLVSVEYTCGLIDDPDPGLLLNPAYDHNFVDNEFVGTALHRRVFAHAPHSHVEHLHPIHRKNEIDETYLKGQRQFAEDRDLHRDRRVMWARPGGED